MSTPAARQTSSPATAPGSPVVPMRDAARSLDLGNTEKFRTVRRFPVLDAHGAIPKTIYDPAAVTRANPKGLVRRMLEVTEEDLQTIADNSNRLVASGRPPLIQIGHTPLDQDRPESFLPKPVGLASNFDVAEVDGRPWLVCDLHTRVDRADEASDYPNLSVERRNWHDPSAHAVTAIARIRREPERPVPMVPYGSDTVAGPLVCYSRDVPAPPAAFDPATDPTLRGARIAFAVARGLAGGEARERFARAYEPAGPPAGGERANYERIISEAVARGTVLDDAGREGLLDLVCGLPADKREASLRGHLARYQTDVSRSRVAWMVRHGVSGDEGRRAYAAAVGA